MTRCGHTGRLLRVCLTDRSFRTEEIPLDWYQRFLGGRGFSSWLLFNSAGPETEPLSTANPLIFAPGALHGTPVPAASRTTLAVKSLLSGGHGDAHAGGFMGGELRAAGYDALIIEGQAATPTWIMVDDGMVTFHDASDLWGMKVSQTAEAIRQRAGRPRMQTAVIGPAGENLVRFANVTDGKASFSRCGVGAVMGLKKLKGLGVRGTGGIAIADPARLFKAISTYNEVIKKDPYCPPATKFGTTRFMWHRVKFGIHGACNWTRGGFDWEGLAPEAFREKHTIKAASCPMCPLRCRRDFEIRDGKNKGTVAKVEWEAIARSMTCGLTETEEAIRMMDAYNELGMDVESGADTIAFAMECYERGILSRSETDGLDLRFGNIEAVLAVLEKITYRQGVGDVLADGVKRAAQKIGRGSERYAMHVKGVEMTAGDPRGMPVRAVSYATSTRGSDHLRSNPYVEEFCTPEEAERYFGSPEAASLKGMRGKGAMLKWSEDLVTIGDILGLCKFAFYRSATMEYLRQKGMHLAAEFYSAVSGREVTGDDLLAVAERVYNIEKAFNVRNGLSKKDDIIPERFFKEGIIGGIGHGNIVERYQFDCILDDYYQARGWDPATSLQTRAGLIRIGLPEVAQVLASEARSDRRGLADQPAERVKEASDDGGK